MNTKEDLIDIIKNERVYPVFQPIVSLHNGDILGYEALSRIVNPKIIQNPEELFKLGVLFDKTWELEKMCRKKILSRYSKFPNEEQLGKLFINVNPLVMQDEHFKSDFTRKQLEKRGISSEKIVIEVTERNTIDDVEELVETINHYKGESYQIAIDDVGSCYSGLNVVCNTHPHYLKIDMELIREINSDKMKQALVKSLVELAKNCSIELLAEGIETDAELKTLIDLGVDYGQGYYLGRPNQSLIAVNEDAYQIITGHKVQRDDSYKMWNGKKYKVVQVSMSNPKAFNAYAEKYGDNKADEAVHKMFRVTEGLLIKDEYMHVVDENTCIIVVQKDRCDSICNQICETFRTSLACLYDADDLVKGYLEVVNTKGNTKKRDLLSVKVEDMQLSIA